MNVSFLFIHPESTSLKNIDDKLFHGDENVSVTVPYVTILRGNRLKEYYEIVGESHPLSAFFPHTYGFVYRNAFLLMKLSNPPSF